MALGEVDYFLKMAYYIEYPVTLTLSILSIFAYVFCCLQNFFKVSIFKKTSVSRSGQMFCQTSPDLSPTANVISRCLFLVSKSVLEGLVSFILGLIKQFLKDVDWGDIDYMVIDTPPGTSDEHLSIVQYLGEANVDGAIIVTTPQVWYLVRKKISKLV